MKATAIEVSGIGKRYSLAGRTGSVRAHEAIERSIRRLVGRARRSESDAYWAVRDCSFSVQPGEVVALLGRNGAGKSVLLKMLSRITKPTTGHAFIRGRLAPLLEVGSGFHPELTGRENIYLNGTILGERRAMIEQKFDEIVAFSNIGRFLDSPVKRYSSGMYMRLAFSVAAHLNTDVMLIDEVLAVGDEAFQERCLDRIQLSAERGTTILLVSHSMKTVESLCTRGLYLDGGELIFDGPVAEAIERYQEQG